MKLGILGAGPGGYVAALRAAQLGADVTVIEEDEVGGTCLNRGCIPTKTLIASARALSAARGLESFGIGFSGAVAPDMEKIISRKNKVVGTQVKGIRALFKSWNVQLAHGRGELVSAGEIRIAARDGNSRTEAFDRIIVATGSRPAELPAFPFDGSRVISSTEALELAEIPGRLIIIGAGVIGCEFASIFSELGSEVTMLEMAHRPLLSEDPEIAELLQKEFKKRKIKLMTGVAVQKTVAAADGVTVVLSDGREFTADKLLVSIGREFNSKAIGAGAVGLKTGSRGEILVNEKMETSVPGIYAVGDVTGRMLLAHVASKQGHAAAENAMGGSSVMDYSVVPSAVFTSPEIASVGLRQNQAAEEGLRVRIGRFNFRGLGKAHAMGEISGFIKIIAAEDTDVLLGAHIIGPHASDLIHELALAIRKGLTSKDVAATIHAHPTLSEGIMEAAADIHGEAVHVPRQ